jgi:hypothetical protein
MGFWRNFSCGLLTFCSYENFQPSLLLAFCNGRDFFGPQFAFHFYGQRQSIWHCIPRPSGLCASRPLPGLVSEIVAHCRYLRPAGVVTIGILIFGIFMIHLRDGWFVVGGGRNGVEFNFLLIFAWLSLMFPGEKRD